jgi:enoyl-CoA hydratase
MSGMTLQIDRDASGYAVLTFNRPAAMNALSGQLRQELAEALDELAKDASIRVLILTGAGKAFCAGIDLKELGQAGSQALGSSGTASNVLEAMGRFKGPIIAAINGPAITGGFEIALACDIILASSAARFADTHARVGVMPGWGLSQKLSRVIGPYRAKELSLTGNFLSAEQAAEWGLVNRVVAPEQLMPVARQLAADMLSAEPHMLIALKKVMDDGYAVSLADGLGIEGERARAANTVVKPGEVEARRAAIRERGKAQSKG